MRKAWRRARGAGQRDHGQHRDGRADQPAGRQRQGERLRPPEMDCQHRPQGRAARNADQAGLSQWIAQITLQRRAREAERAADKRPQDCARQTESPRR